MRSGTYSLGGNKKGKKGKPSSLKKKLPIRAWRKPKEDKSAGQGFGEKKDQNGATADGWKNRSGARGEGGALIQKVCRGRRQYPSQDIEGHQERV